MATLHYMHSDHVDHAVLVEFMAMGLEMQMDGVTAERDAGAIPDDQITDVIYGDLIADPDRACRAALRRVGPARQRAFRAALDAYLAARHTDRAPATTTPSPTPASTWPPTGPSSPPTRSASGCRPR